MKYASILLLVAISCNDGGGLVDTGSTIFSRVSEQTLNDVFQTAEIIYANVSENPFAFSTISECETENILRINDEEVKLVRAAFQLSEFGSDFFAFDTNLRYAIIVSLADGSNNQFSVSDFILQGGNDIIIYRLRPTGTDSFRIISVHTLRNSPGQFINVCVASNGIVFSGDNLVFNRISTLVSLNFRSRQLN